MKSVTRNLHWPGKLRITDRLLRVLSLVVLLLLFAGCSTRFIYNQLDTFIVWKIDDYVPLTSEQKTELKLQINEQLEVVRQDDLPKLAALLDGLAKEVESGSVTPASLDKRYAQMINLTDEFMLGVVPVAEWLLLDLDEEQVADMFENFEELNQEMYEDYSGETPEERRENRNKSAIKITQSYTGRLSADQKRLITDSLASMEDASEQWIEYQREWQRRFRELVEHPPPSAQFREELTRLLVYPRSFHSPQYRTIVDSNRQIFNSMMAELASGLTDKQRARAVDKLRGYVELLTKLAEAA